MEHDQSIRSGYVAFFFALVRSWWTARNQGVDEGATSVVAIKFLETSFWPMFLCLIFAAIPISTTPTVVYKQYSCLASPSLFNDLNDSSTATPEALSALNSDKGAYSLVGGLVHTISTGANESMTSKLSCSSGASRQEVNIIVKTLIQRQKLSTSLFSFFIGNVICQH